MNNQEKSVEIVDDTVATIDTLSFEIDNIPHVDTLFSDSIELRAEGAKFGWVDIDVWITNKHLSQIICFDYSTRQIIGDSTKYLIGGEMKCTIDGGKKKKTQVSKQLEKVTYRSVNKYIFELKYRIVGQDNIVYIARCPFVNIGDFELLPDGSMAAEVE